jgi:hypothetical protein
MSDIVKAYRQDLQNAKIEILEKALINADDRIEKERESLKNAVILLHASELHVGHSVGPSSECAKCKAYLNGEL